MYSCMVQPNTLRKRRQRLREKALSVTIKRKKHVKSNTREGANLARKKALLDFIDTENDVITDEWLNRRLLGCQLYEAGDPNWERNGLNNNREFFCSEDSNPGRHGGDDGGGDDGDDGGSSSSDDDDEEHGSGRRGPVGSSFFKDVLKSPKKALLLFYLNSGLHRFQRYKDYSSQHDGEPVDIEALKEEIKEEQLTNDEMADITSRFLKCHSFTGEDMPSCGACGIRCFERHEQPRIRFEEFPLEHPLLRALKYTEGESVSILKVIRDPRSNVEIPVDDSWTTRTVQTWRVRSVFCENEPPNDGDISTWNDATFWHLHPELIHENEEGLLCTTLCPICVGNLKKEEPTRPPLSIAAGVDFGYYGRLDGVQLPSLLEQMILARCRLFFATLKITSNTYGVVNSSCKNKLKCHAIIYPHNAPEVASYMYNSDVFGKDGILDRNMLKGLMQVYLLDHKGNQDALANTIFGSNICTAKPWVIAQWLLILRQSNPYYSDLKVDRLHDLIEVTDSINEHLRQEVTVISNEAEVSREQTIGSDIAGGLNVEINSNSQQRQREEESSREEPNSPIPVSYSYVTNSTEAYLCENKEDFRFRALARFANLNDGSSGGVNHHGRDFQGKLFDESAMDDYLQRYPMNLSSSSTRGEDPYSDYERNDHAITTTFPHAFLLGKLYGRPIGRLTQEQKLHLLNQFHMVPARDRRLLGFLYDVGLRTDVVDGVKAYAEGNPRSVDQLRHLMSNTEERQILKEAMDFPYTESAKRVIDKWLMHLRISSKNVAYGALEGTKLKHRIIGSAKRFSANSTFLTFSPANLDNPRALRMTFRTANNGTFPSTFEDGCPYGATGTEFMENMQDFPVVTEGNITLPKSDRAGRTVDNPVAFVMENKQLLHDILTILLGVPVEDKGFFTKMSGQSERSTKYYRTRKGVYGYALHNMGVTEGHARGTLHWHFNLNAGVSPYVLQRFSVLPEICEEITKYLDMCYCSSIPSNLHIQAIVKKVLSKHRDSWKVPNDVATSVSIPGVLASKAKLFSRIENGDRRPCTVNRIKRAARIQAGRQNIHQHQQTCKKGPRGEEGCRLDYRQPCSSVTHNVRLVPSRQGGSTSSLQLQQDSPGADNSTQHEDNPSIEGEPSDNPVETVEDQDDDNPVETRNYKVMTDSDRVSEAEESRSHRLVDVLEKTRRKSVVVWETRRPLCSLGTFEQSPMEKDNPRQFIVDAFQHAFLSDDTIFSGNVDSLWTWMKEEASLDQLQHLYKEIQAQLPTANGYVAAFCPPLSYCTGSHNNSSLLGSIDQSMSALFYLIPYEAKPKFPLEQSLSIINNTLQHIVHHVSRADDSGTIQRTVKHFLTRAINKLHLLIEISDWEMVAKIIGLPSMITSEKYSIADPSSLPNLLTRFQLSEDKSQVFESLHGELTATRHRRQLEERLRASRHRTQNRVTENPTGITPSRVMVQLPDDCIHHVFRFLCYEQSHETVAANDQPVSLVEQYKINVLPLLLLNKDHHKRLKYDPYLTAIADQAYLQAHQQQQSPYQYSAVGSSFGHIEQVKVNVSMSNQPEDPSNPQRTIFIPTDSTYWFRSQQLENITYYEYRACFTFHKNKKPRKNPGGDPNKLNQQTQFILDQQFPAHEDSYIVINKKQCTPLAIGTIPKHPGSEPIMDNEEDGQQQKRHAKWREKADLYAKYYLSYFRPHSFRTEDTTYTWDDLEEWIQFLQNDESIISTFRLMIMKQHMDGITTSEMCKTMGREYRSRVRDMWSNAVRNDIRRQKGLEMQSRKNNQAYVCDPEDFTGFSPQTIRSMTEQIQHNEDQTLAMETLLHVANSGEDELQDHQQFARRSQWMSIMCTRNMRDMQLKLDEMFEWMADIDDDASRAGTGDRGGTSLEQLELQARTIRSRLMDPRNPQHKQQVRLFEDLCDHLGIRVNRRRQKPAQPFPQIVMVHGGAGMGKTTLRNAILDLYEAMRRYQWRLSFNHMNAAEMGGQTICSWIGNNRNNCDQVGTFHGKTVHQLRSLGFTTNALTCIEEFENTAPRHYARITKLAEEATFNRGQHYGGTQCFKFGDLGQIGPVLEKRNIAGVIMDKYLDDDLQKKMPAKKKQKLEQSSITPETRKHQNRYNADHPDMIGSRLFTSARWYELNEQKRSNDPIHTNNVRKLYQGQVFTFEDLKDNDYKMFSSEDASSGDWDDASVIVATNRERFSLTHTRAKAFGRSKGHPIFRWLVNIKDDWQNKPRESSYVRALQDPCLHQYFVKGCSAFLDDKYLPKLGIVKGIPVRYHSMKFRQEDEVRARELIQRTPPGTVCDLPFCPLMIIVEMDIPPNVEEQTVNALKRFSIGTPARGKVLVPICQTTCTPSNRPVIVYGGEGYGPSKVTIQNVFPLQTAFAITANKSLGATLPRVIIALSYNKAQGCNFDYQQLYVALTRVEERANIRLLLTGRNEVEQWRSLSYLGDLRPDPAQVFFFCGFRHYNEAEPNENWKMDAWNPSRANAKFRRLLQEKKVVL